MNRNLSIWLSFLLVLHCILLESNLPVNTLETNSDIKPHLILTKKPNVHLSKSYFSMRRKLVSVIKKTLTPEIFKSWQKNLQKKKVALKDLSNSDLREILIELENEPVSSNGRKLVGLPEKVTENATMNTYIKELTGGTLSVRLANLPQVVMVNQAPYYQYLVI